MKDSKLNKLKAILMMKETNKVSFHSAMQFPLVMAQIFGFFPVFGVTNYDYRALKFAWCSLKTVYSLCSLLLFMLLGILRLLWVAIIDNSLREINQLVFTICGIISSCLFIKLARQWPELVRLWHVIETYQGNKGITTNLKWRIKMITIFFLIFATIEHLLVQLYNLTLCINCTRTVSEGFHQYFAHINWPHVFAVIEYSLWRAILIQLSNIQMTFIWTYIDIFIIIVSLAFTVRIVQLRRKIKNTLRHKIKSLNAWQNLREEHIYLERLCAKLNDNISLIVLLCFWTNLYFTLTQLYGSVEGNNRNLLRKIYYYSSFSLVIGRTVCVCLCAATVNNESNSILPILLETPSDIYNVEIQRFIEQMSHTNLAISGKKFFTITKGIILNIAGSIVTYELVLIQFRIDWGDNRFHSLKSSQSNNSVWLC